MTNVVTRDRDRPVRRPSRAASRCDRIARSEEAREAEARLLQAEDIRREIPEWEGGEK